MTKVLLIDVENQTKKLKELNKLLKQYDQIVLVYAASNLSLPLDDVLFLSQAIHDQRLLIIKMPKAGADSADFGLTFIAGRLSAKLSTDSTVDVMSNDRKLSYVVDLLNQIGIRTQQIKQTLQESQGIDDSNLSDESVLEHLEHSPSTSKHVAVIPTEHMGKVLKQLEKNQPKSLKSLKKSLMSWCKLTKKQVEVVVMELQQHQVICVKETKITYQLKTLRKSIKVQSSSIQEKHQAIQESVDSNKPHLQRIQQFASHLLKINKSRPAKLDTLQNVIKSTFKYDKDENVEQMINLLKKHQLIQLNESKVNYQEEIIKKWCSVF